MDRPTPASVDFLWTQAERRLDAQMRQTDALDTKSGALVGLHALAAGIVATVVGNLEGAARWVAVGVLAGLIFTGTFAFLSYRIEDYDRSPGPEELWLFGDWQEGQIRYRFLSTRFRALEENRKKLKAKARRITWSLSGLSLIAFAVTVAAAVGLVRN